VEEIPAVQQRSPFPQSGEHAISDYSICESILVLDNFSTLFCWYLEVICGSGMKQKKPRRF
jgi:hypothetical protein